MSQPKLYLQAVVVHKRPGLAFEDARKMAQSVIQNGRKKFVRETESSWRFRNIPKTEFVLGSFVSKVVSKDMTLIFGHLE